MLLRFFTLCLLVFTSSIVAAELSTKSIGMKLVRIEAGTFMMGQDGPQADYKMWAHPTKDDDADGNLL